MTIQLWSITLMKRISTGSTISWMMKSGVRNASYRTQLRHSIASLTFMWARTLNLAVPFRSGLQTLRWRNIKMDNVSPSNWLSCHIRRLKLSFNSQHHIRTVSSWSMRSTWWDKFPPMTICLVVMQTSIVLQVKNLWTEQTTKSTNIDRLLLNAANLLQNLIALKVSPIHSWDKLRVMSTGMDPLMIDEEMTLIVHR